MKEAPECELCDDAGWVDCDTSWCSDDGHGGYCSCRAGVERQLEEAG